MSTRHCILTHLSGCYGSLIAGFISRDKGIVGGRVVGVWYL